MLNHAWFIFLNIHIFCLLFIKSPCRLWLVMPTVTNLYNELYDYDDSDDDKIKNIYDDNDKEIMIMIIIIMMIMILTIVILIMIIIISCRCLQIDYVSDYHP